VETKAPLFQPIVSTETISEQAYKTLKNLLENGSFSPGQKLPSEPEIARQLNISRITLRTALQKLELLGYIDRKRGVGTFVVGIPNKQMDAGIERLVSISDVMRQRGHQPGTQEMDIAAQNADESIARELRINIGDPITVISRVRTMDGKPIIFDRSAFPSTIIPQDITSEELGDSLFAYVLKTKHLNITHAVARLVPAIADDFLSSKLHVNKGTLLIRLVQTHYIKENDSPVWQSTLSCPESDFSWYIVRTR